VPNTTNDDLSEESHKDDFYKFPFMGMSAEVVKNKEKIFLYENPKDDQRFVEDIDNITGVIQMKNLFLVPLIHEENCIGVLQIVNKYGSI